MTIKGTSHPAVIGLDGQITPPLETVEVQLFYETADGNIGAPQKQTVPGQYAAEPGDNPRPSLLPGLREWKGGRGFWTFSGRLVLADAALEDTGRLVGEAIHAMAGCSVAVLVGRPQDGDLYLVHTGETALGEEGYRLEIGTVLTACAPRAKGLLYAGYTVAQLLGQERERLCIPQGLARDYPQYPVRAVMLDVGRFFIPIDYLAEITRYAAFFKINEMHIHLNDDSGEDDGSFRIACRTCPGLNGSAPYYTQEEYRAYQKEAKRYSIEVVSEIDTPSHCFQIQRVRPDLMLDNRHIDLNNPDTLKFIQGLLDEWLDGEDPVFQGNKFNIGTDEYPKEHAESVRAYIDALIRYVSGKGREVRMWASLGRTGFAGKTPVSRNATALMWSHIWGNLEDMVEAGYRMINAADAPLYVVPEAAYNNYLNIERLFDTWEVTDFWYGHRMEKGHPQLMGAEACLWNDARNGQSEFDIFDRFRDQICLIAEKAWFGDKRPDQTGAEFVRRARRAAVCAPKANPARRVVSAAELVASYRFDKTGCTAADQSGNGYDAQLHGLEILDGAARLNGVGYLSLPFDSLGYPYTVRLDLELADDTPMDAVLFAGRDGTLLANYHGTGKLGYRRKGYAYCLNFVIPTHVRLDLTLTCSSDDQSLETRLYVDGAEIGSGRYAPGTPPWRQESSTFVLPTERIGQGVRGKLYGMQLYNRALSPAEVAGGSFVCRNLALRRPVRASGVEGGKQPDGTWVNPDFAPEMAVDGDRFTRHVFPRREQGCWFEVDLGEPCMIESLRIRFAEMPESYEIRTSLDGEHFTRASLRDGLPGRATQKDELAFSEAVCARYVRYEERRMFHIEGEGDFSGWFYEFEIYGVERAALESRLHAARQALSQGRGVETARQVLAAICDRLEELLTAGGPGNRMRYLAAVLEARTKQLPAETADSCPAIDRQPLTALLQKHEGTVLSPEQEVVYRFGEAVWSSFHLTQPKADAVTAVLTRLLG